MTEFPPPQAESKDGWWKRRSSMTKGLIIVGALVLGIGAIGSALDPEPEETTSTLPTAASVAPDVTEPPSPTTEPEPEVTEPPVTEPPATAPPVTAPPADEFHVWLVGQLPEITAVSADMQIIAPLIDAGEFEQAGQTAIDIGATFQGLYFAAPETGTELSEVTNEMLVTCSVAYTAAGNAILDMDIDAMNGSVSGIQRCTELLNESSTLLPN